MEEQKKIGYHHKKVEIYATTFLMPIIFYITLFVWEGIYPFGEKSNLIWDLEVQYVDYYNFFREFLKNRSGGVFFYKIFRWFCDCSYWILFSVAI